MAFPQGPLKDDINMNSREDIYFSGLLSHKNFVQVSEGTLYTSQIGLILITHHPSCKPHPNPPSHRAALSSPMGSGQVQSRLWPKGAGEGQQEARLGE